MRSGCNSFLIVLSLIGSMLLCFPFETLVQAQIEEVPIGVKVGDWVKYGNFLVTWDSPDLLPDAELLEFNNTDWIQDEVIDIINTVVIFSQKTRFKNATQRSSAFQIDVAFGGGNDSYTLIPARLNIGDPIYPLIPNPFWINQTITRTYAGAAREVNLMKATEDNPPNILSLSISRYWDRETGILTEILGSGTYKDQAGNILASWTRSNVIVETNLWSAGEPPPNGQNGGGIDFTYAIVAVVMVGLILLGAWLLWPQKRKTKKRKSRMRRQIARVRTLFDVGFFRLWKYDFYRVAACKLFSTADQLASNR